jgi:hypothetical protein
MKYHNPFKDFIKTMGRQYRGPNHSPSGPTSLKSYNQGILEYHIPPPLFFHIGLHIDFTGNLPGVRTPNQVL